MVHVNCSYNTFWKKYFELTHKSTPLPESSIERLFLTWNKIKCRRVLIIIIEAGLIIPYLIAKQPKWSLDSEFIKSC